MYSINAICRLARTGFLAASLLLTVLADCYSQAVKGTVISGEKKPLVYASVALLAAKDSSLIKGQVTSASGSFVFPAIAPGHYLLQISSSGFEEAFSKPFLLEKQDFDAGEFALKETGVQLEKVVVTARKPLFERKIDRMVVNVRNSITAAGGSALDVLERSPGILINRQGNTISMSGKDGVVVMINGKISRMPLSGIIQMLSGMNAANIEKIELITTPPASLDAEGNAGYINIILVNNPDRGLNGSYSVTGGWGKGERSSAGMNFNYRHNKLNFYGDYSFSRNRTGQLVRNFRRVEYQGDTIENNTISHRDPVQRNHNARVGMDYNFSKRTVLGVLLAMYDNKWEMDATNFFSKTINGQADTSIQIDNHEVNQWKHFMANLNLQRSFSADESVSFDLNYIWFQDNNPTDYVNHFYKPQDNFLFSTQTKSGKLTPINIYVAAADYSKKLHEKWKMQAGVKFSASKFTNDVRVENYLQNVWTADPAYTDKYLLKENIYAGYISVDGVAGEKTSIKIGARYEYTFSNLGTPTRKNIVNREYGRLFPTIFVNRKIDDNESMNFSYSRRITRPTFNELAPFIIFIDPNTFFSGNSILQPSITDVVKADYLFKNYLFSLSYSYGNNTIARFQTEVDLSNNKQFLSAQNLSYTKMINADFSIPVTLTKWWNSQTNLSVSWQEVKASYKGAPVKQSRATGYASTAQSFKLPRNFSAELTGIYIAPSIFGTSIFKSMSKLNVGVQKKFSSGSRLQFNVSDIFGSMQFRLKTVVPGQPFYANAYYGISQRTWLLTWTSPFGKKDLKGNRKRDTRAEEEKGRVQ